MCDFYCTKTVAEPPTKDASVTVTALCQKTTITYTSTPTKPGVRCGKGEIPKQCSAGSFWADADGNRIMKTTAITTDSLTCATARGTATISCSEDVGHERVYVAVSNSINGVTAPATCDSNGFRPIACNCYSPLGGTCHMSSSGCKLTSGGVNSWVQTLCKRQTYTYEANSNVACKTGQMPLQCGAVSTSPTDKINGAVWSPFFSCTASRARIVCADTTEGLKHGHTWLKIHLQMRVYTDNHCRCTNTCVRMEGALAHTHFFLTHEGLCDYYVQTSNENTLGTGTVAATCRAEYVASSCTCSSYTGGAYEKKRVTRRVR